MRRLEIRLREGKLTYKPGEELVGKVVWELGAPPDSLSLRLLWHTSGKVEPEISLVGSREIPAGDRGEEEFRFRLPTGPISFVGQLVTLAWALELVAEPGSEATRMEILVTETGRELRLPRLDLPKIRFGGR